MRIRRRDFLKASVAVGAAAALSPRLNALAAASESRRFGEAPGRWVPTTCQGCTTWCPLEVFVQDGRAVKVRGNRHSRQNDGVCCPRGHLGLEMVYDPDRIKVPLKRTNPKKGRGEDPRFVPITWDEALDTIADRMMALRAAGEAHKYMFLRGRYSETTDVFYDAGTKIFGSPNNISHSSICAEAEKFGPYYSEGMWDYRDYDLDNCKYLLVWGCDPVSSNRMVPASIKRLSGIVKRGTVAVVDPKQQTTALKAQEWLPIRPGQDGALAVALAHEILVNGWWNREFVGDFSDKRNRFKAGKTVDPATFAEVHTNGLVAWWNLELKDRTPKWAAGVTGIDEKQIKRVARGLGENAPNVAVWMGPGATMQVRGAYISMAVHVLNGLLGAVDSEGGSLGKVSTPDLKFPVVDAYLDDIAKAKQKKIDHRGDKNFPSLKEGKPGGGVVTNNAAAGMLAADPYDIKVVIGCFSNFAFSCTGAQRWEQAFEKLPFFANLTTHVSESSMYADILLPAAMTTYEKWGYLKGKQNRYAYVSLLQPVIEPLWDVRGDETEFAWLLAERLAARGFPNLLDYYRNEYKDPDTGLGATSAREFALVATKHFLGPVWTTAKGKGGDTVENWDDMLARGMWNSDPFKYRSRWDKFKTTTTKFEFYSETLKKALTEHAEKHKTTVDDILETCDYTARGELAFVPHYEEPFRRGDPAEFPFTFVDYKSRLNREGRSANTTWYQEFKKLDPGDRSWDDILKLNPQDAARLGIGNGDMVRLTSVSGTFELKAAPWEGVPPGVVTKCFGQGHWAYGRVAAEEFGRKARGVNNNEIMPAEYERLSGSTARNGGFTGVRIEKI